MLNVPSSFCGNAAGKTLQTIVRVSSPARISTGTEAPGASPVSRRIARWLSARPAVSVTASRIGASGDSTSTRPTPLASSVGSGGSAVPKMPTHTWIAPGGAT